MRAFYLTFSTEPLSRYLCIDSYLDIRKIVGTINSVYEGSDMLIINVEDGSGEIKVVL